MKILVVQTYGLGNAILTTPLIQAISQLTVDQGKKAHEVHVCADYKRKAAAAVLAMCPGVKKCWDIPQTGQMLKERFDLAIMCSDDPRLVELVRVPRVQWCFIKRETGESRESWFQRWSNHEMLVYFQAAKDLGFAGQMPKVFMPINKEISVACPGPRVALGIGYYKGDSWSKNKHWGNQKFAEIARRFRAIGGTCFMLGDQQDFDMDGRVIRQLAGPAVVSLCGKFGLSGTLGALAQCQMYIGNDTAFSHAAAALDLHTCTIFKPWNSSPAKDYPFGKNACFAIEWPGEDLTEAIWNWASVVIDKNDLRK